jgi:hypothetical protein
MKSIQIDKVASFKSKFVTGSDGTVYVRFDFESFFEWYQRQGTNFSIIEAEKTSVLEAALQEFESSKRQNVIYLGEI